MTEAEKHELRLELSCQEPADFLVFVGSSCAVGVAALIYGFSRESQDLALLSLIALVFAAMACKSLVSPWYHRDYVCGNQGL